MKLKHLFILFLLSVSLVGKSEIDTTLPWTYWWVMGSSMEERDITAQFETMKQAGIGGVHLVPIYGEKGDEANYLDYLTPEWLDRFSFLVSEANRLGIGVDMTFGTGWPFGGKDITPEYAAKRIDKSGEIALTGQYVKRAAPGAEGLVIDPFSYTATRYYLKRFDLPRIRNNVRAFYNDSYEIYGANWTDDFLGEFSRRRGYDLSPYLSVIKENEELPDASRVWQDYHRTIADLLSEYFTHPFDSVAHALGGVSRNQAHGSPGNLIDLYGQCDIPETESFGSSNFNIPLVRVDENYEVDRFGRPNPLMMKFASSAAHLHGKPLVSAEALTWLADHFKVTLSQIKPQIDELFTAGINHLFFHGTTFSPVDKPFPGRLFYASTNFNRHSHFYEYLPELSRYISNCQRVLQQSSANNDLLLYFPAHDYWRKMGDNQNVYLFDVHKVRTDDELKSFDHAAIWLKNNGYAFDYISDNILRQAIVRDGAIVLSGGSYKALLIPRVNDLPFETYHEIDRLINDGARVLFEEAFPNNVTGLADYQNRQAALSDITKRWKEQLPAPDILSRLLPSKIRSEEMARKGLSFIRKQLADTTCYFIANLENRFERGIITLSSPAKSVLYSSPLTGKEQPLEIRSSSPTSVSVELSLLPGESCILKLLSHKTAGKKMNFPVFKTEKELNAPFTITFLKGEPRLLPPIVTDKLKSWTLLGDTSQTAFFSGTARYETTFELENIPSSATLDLGDLREMATVYINEVEIGKVWSVPYRLSIPKGVLKKQNKLWIDVTNLSYNRVIKMDRDGILWRNFHEINFVNIRYQPFDASGAEPVPSGLLKPIKLLIP